MNSSRIYVGDLDPTVTEEDLKNEFSSYGNIKNIEVKNKLDIEGEPISKFAYVTLEGRASEINKCISILDGSTLKKSIIKVEAARESFLERLKREREQNANQNSHNSSKSYNSTNSQNASCQSQNGNNFKKFNIIDKNPGKHFQRYKLEEQNALHSYKDEHNSHFPTQSYDSLSVLKLSLTKKNDLSNGNKREYKKKKCETDAESRTQEFMDPNLKYGYTVTKHRKTKVSFSSDGHNNSDAPGNLSPNRNLPHNQAQFSPVHHKTTSPSGFSLLAMCGRADPTKLHNAKNHSEEKKEASYFDQQVNHNKKFSAACDFQEPIKRQNKSKREENVQINEPTEELDDRKFFINPDDPNLEAGVEWLLTRPLASEIIDAFKDIQPSLIEICMNLRKTPAEKLKTKGKDPK